MWCRGIRGATTVETNTKEAILAATRELLQEMINANELQPGNVAAAIFSTTFDLNAEFPAVAARQLGWDKVALMCTHETPVPGSLPMCLRILLLVNSDKKQDEMVFVYTKGAQNLRSDPPPIDAAPGQG